MRLVNALRTKGPSGGIGPTISGNDLADHVIGNVRSIAEAKLAHIPSLFTQYTDHTVRHSDSVVVILDRIVPDELLQKMNEWELYFLLCACYLHDIGMLEACPPLSSD